MLSPVRVENVDVCTKRGEEGGGAGKGAGLYLVWGLGLHLCLGLRVFTGYNLLYDHL